MKILIVDDDRIIHLTYTKPLINQGYEVMSAYNGDECLEMVAGEKPDIIVLDINMPGRDGRDICKALKSSDETKHIPIIMLTSKDSHHDRRTGIDVGADEYVEKPCPIFYLERTITKIIRKMKTVQ